MKHIFVCVHSTDLHLFAYRFLWCLLFTCVSVISLEVPHVAFLKEENESLRYQVQAYVNEVQIMKAEMLKKEEIFKVQVKALQNSLSAMQQVGESLGNTPVFYRAYHSCLLQGLSLPLTSGFITHLKTLLFTKNVSLILKYSYFQQVSSLI